MLADQYGFVLVGSNISKNGMPWEQTMDIANTMMNDAAARVSIDPKRVYTAGFSGGSRVACAFAMSNGGIAGVIGCGAGFPGIQPQWQNSFDYFGIAGTHDFNMNEMVQWDQTLAQNGHTHQLLLSEGTHGWPSPHNMAFAMQWMQVAAMKEQKQAKDEAIIAALKKSYEQELAFTKAKGDVIKEGMLLDGMIKVLEGSMDISSYKEQMTDLLRSDKYKQAVAGQNKLQQAEQQEEQGISTQFATESKEYWDKKIAELNNNIRSKPLLESQMNGRMLAYLGLVAYMNAGAALKSGDLAKADTYIKIFRKSDPKNSDGAYLNAQYDMQKGNKQQALSSLKEAVNMGYSDVNQLLTEPVFSSLANDDAFKTVVTRTAENNRAVDK
jgi:dienelactone hydrolase